MTPPPRTAEILVPRARTVHAANDQPATPDSPQAAQVLAKATVRAAEALKLTGQQLAAVLGMSEASISRLRESSGRMRPASNEGQRAVLFLRSYRFVEALVGGNLEHARAWFLGENHALGAVPLDMMKSIVGMVRVESYLQEMAAK